MHTTCIFRPLRLLTRNVLADPAPASLTKPANHLAQAPTTLAIRWHILSRHAAQRLPAEVRGQASFHVKCTMSRLNCLTDEELALDGIDQELRLLEQLAAGGLQLDASQLDTLAEYRDRISQLMIPLPSTAEAGEAEMQTVQPTLSRRSKVAELRTEEPSIEELRQSIWKLLDEAMS